MPITVTTVYTRDRILRFEIFSAINKKFFWCFMSVCTLIIVVCHTYLSHLELSSDTVDLCLLIVSLIDLTYLFCSFVLPYLTIKKNKALGTSVTYLFEDNNLHIDSTSPLVSQSTTLQYGMLKRVVKNKTELYLYISGQQAFVVDLSALPTQQLTLLKDALAAALNPKKVRW